MPNNVHNIDRFLAAHEGGSGVYPQYVMDWLANGLRAYRTDPAVRLDKILGLRPGRGQRSIASGYCDQHCARLYRDFYKTYYKGVEPTTAAKDIDFNFDELAKDCDDLNIDQHFKDLYDEVMAAKGKVPKWRTIYNALQANA